MRKGWIFLLLCFLQISTNAQETTVTATHTNGVVEYFNTPGAVARRVFPGMKMDLSGSLRCQANASVKLLYRGVAFESNTVKMLTLAELVGSVNTEGQADFTGRFWNFIHKSVEETDNDEKLKASHQSFMERTRGSKKGMGSHNNAITALPLASGVLPADAVWFNWRHTASAAPFTFILRTSDGKQLAQIQVRDTILSLDFGQLPLQFNEGYEWVIMQGDSSYSATMTFRVSGDIVQKADSKLKSEGNFASANPEEQALMRAYYYEEAKCYFLANETYRQVLATSPDNQFLRMIYAAFLSRMDMLPEGQMLLRP